MKRKSLPQDGFYSISQVADLLHVSTHTIRNLEREFSLEVTKDQSGNRIYTLETVEKYRTLIDNKNISKQINFSSKVAGSEELTQSTPEQFSTTEEETLSYNENIVTEQPVYSKNSNFANTRNTQVSLSIPQFIFNFPKFVSSASFALLAVSILVTYGSFSLNSMINNSILSKIMTFDTSEKQIASNVLQSTTEDWTYRFDVNLPTYINSSLNVSGSLAGSQASFQLINVGQVSISETGISAPNVVNLVSTKAGENVIVVDNTNRNNPTISIAANPNFNNITVANLSGVTKLDAKTITTINNAIKVQANTDATTLEGFAAADFLRSNANTTYTGGTFEFGPTSTVKMSNLSANTFLRLNSANVITSYDIVAGPNISISTTANSLVISASTGATANVFSSAAIKDLFLGTDSFDSNYLLVSTVTELNKLHTLSGNLVTSTNLSSNIFTVFPQIDTNASDDVLISSLASLVLSNFPNLDTNASDDNSNAVLVDSLGGKDVYSANTWYGYQNFSNISAFNYTVEANGSIYLTAGAIPAQTSSSLYNHSNRLYFEELPLLQVSDTSISHVNKLAYFVTDASGKLYIQGTSSISLNVFESGSNGQILGVFGNQTKYLTVNGDLNVSTTSSSAVTFTLNNVNSNPGTYGSGTFIPQITVNSKGQITSVATIAASNNYVTGISYSTPSNGSRVFTVNRLGLTDLTASFSLNNSDIIAALGYTPLGATDTAADKFINSFGLNTTSTTGNVSYFFSIARNDGTTFPVSFALTPEVLTTALGYTPLQATDTGADKFINSYGVATSYVSSNVSYNFSIARNDGTTFPVSISLTPAVITTALGYVPQVNLGYTPVNKAGDTISGNLNITGSLAAVSIYQNGNLVCDRSGNCSDVYVDTTNANNYVTAITFSDPANAQKALVLTRNGLSNLTAIFSLSSSDITTALGYTPLGATNTVADKFINSFGIAPTYISQNVQLNFSLGRSDSTVIDSTLVLNPAIVTTALGYTPLRATDTVADKFINSFGLNTTSTSGNVSYFFSIARNDGTTFPVSFALTPSVITNALGYIPQVNLGYTPLQATDTAADKFINSYGVATSYVSSNVSYNFSIARNDGTTFPVSISLTPAVITTALGYVPQVNLGYTPVNKAGDTISGNLNITGSLAAVSIYQNGYSVCDNSGNCTGVGGGIIGSGDAGYLSYFTASNSIANSIIYQTSSRIGILTTNPQEALDVNGAIRLSANMGTLSRSNTLYNDGGVLYWNGQVVGVTGSTGPGGISGTQGYIPYFNTSNSLIATEFRYDMSGTERSLELITTETLPTYMAIGHKGDYNAIFGVAANSSSFFTRYDSEDDVIIKSTSTLSSSDMIFALNNDSGKFLFAFGTGSQNGAVAINYQSGSDSAYLGVNNTNPTFALDVTGSARVTGTLATATFSKPSAGSFNFLSGGNFGGNVSAANGSFSNISLANALPVIFGGTGMASIPNNGQILIGNGAGYTLSSLISGSNISISTGAGSITINSSYVDTTNANNYVTDITFSTPAAAQRTLTLTRTGLSNLTATLSLASNDITAALGYTPLQATDTAADKFINSFGIAPTYISQNVQLNFSLGRSDSSTINATAVLTPAIITTALGYIPLGATDTAADKFINSFGLNTTSTSGNVSYFFSIARNDGTTFPVSFALTPSVVTTALGYVPQVNLGYTPVNKAGDTISGNLNITGSLAAVSIFQNGNIVCDRSGNCSDVYVDTTNANNYVTGITFSTPVAAQRTLTLTQVGLSNLTATLSLASNDITTALGYTPLQATDTVADKFINSFGLNTTSTSGNVSYFFSIARNDGTTFPVSFALTPEVLTTALGYIPLDSTAFNSVNIIGALGYTPLQASDTFADESVNTINSTYNTLWNGLAFRGYINYEFYQGATLKFSNSLEIDPITTSLSSSFDTGSNSFIYDFYNGADLIYQNSTPFGNLEAVSALGYTPVNKAGDTVSGNLAVTGTVSTGYLNLVNNDFPTKSLWVDADTGNFTKRLILDLETGNTDNTTLGMYLQSIKFSAPTTEARNLIFNVLENSPNTQVDILKSGTMPVVSAGVANFYNATIAANIFSSPVAGPSYFLSGLNVRGDLSAAAGTFTGGNFANLFSTNFSAASGNFTTGLFATNFSATLGSFNSVSTGLFSNPSAGSFTFLAGANFNGNLSAALGTFNSVSTGYFSSPLANKTFNFQSGTIANSVFSNPSAGSFTFLAGANFGGDLSAALGTFNSVSSGYFSSPLANKTFNFQSGTIANSVFSNPVAGSFTFLAGANFSGNLSAANGTFITLSAQSLNINNLFTVDNTGSVFNNSVTFNDTIELNAIGDLAIANDLVFTNTAISKIRSATDLTFEVGEPFNSNNFVVNLYNGGKILLNGSTVVSGTFSAGNSSLGATTINGNLSAAAGTFTTGTFTGNLSALNIGTTNFSAASGHFTTGLFATNFSASNANITNLGATTFSAAGGFATNFGVTTNFSATLGSFNSVSTGFFSSPLAAKTFNFLSGTIANSVFSNPLAGSFTFQTGANFSGNLSAAAGTFTTGTFTGNIIASSTSTIAARVFSNPAEANTPLVVGPAGVTYRIGTGPSVASDERLKANFQEVENPLDIVNGLHPVTFNMRDYGDFSQTSAQRQVGFIAQDVEKVFPYLVSDHMIIGDTWYKGLDYSRLTAILVAGMKDQQSQITALSAAQAGVNFSQATSMYDSLMNAIDNLSMSTDNGNLVFNSDIVVNGKTILNETTFTGNVSMGQMQFDTLNNDLSVLGASCVRNDGSLDDNLCQTQSLFIMKAKSGNVNIFDGKVVLKPNGDMQVEKINASEVNAAEYKVTSTSEVSGTATLTANQSEITINSTKVKSNSKIFITASNSLNGKSLFVDTKTEGSSFKVKINEAINSGVTFDWFILNVE